ncbi:MAG: DinB family protein [Gemmatimonadales bacterium]|nr:DinB family protein [Gemmatimonadales bacterium]
MSHTPRDYLLRQLDLAWMLASYHLDTLTTDECLWHPTGHGMHLRQDEGGRWAVDWPEREEYDIGPPSAGWVTWHMLFWWSMVLDYSFGNGTLRREDVRWPGSADEVRAQLGRHYRTWRERIEALSDREITSSERTRWPFPDRPFGDVVAWATIELTKNAAELGYARFLYGARGR